MKKWSNPDVLELNIENTEYGRPNQKIDGTIFGLPISAGPNDDEPNPVEQGSGI